MKDACHAASPVPVGQVLLGVLLGSAVLGWAEADARLRLLGMAGIELGLGNLKAAGWPAFWVAALGIVLSGLLFGGRRGILRRPRHW